MVLVWNVRWNGWEAFVERLLIEGDISGAAYELRQLVRGEAAFWQGVGYWYYRRSD